MGTGGVGSRRKHSVEPKRKRAIHKALYEAEERRMRLAYLKKPDTETAADDWRAAEAWTP